MMDALCGLGGPARHELLASPPSVDLAGAGAVRRTGPNQGYSLRLGRGD
jgi:hypothetical protein